MPAKAGYTLQHRFDPWVGKVPWRRAWQPAPVLLPGESRGQRSLVGYSSGSRKESDTTERLSTHAPITITQTQSEKEISLGHHHLCSEPLLAQNELGNPWTYSRCSSPHWPEPQIPALLCVPFVLSPALQSHPDTQFHTPLVLRLRSWPSA